MLKTCLVITKVQGKQNIDLADMEHAQVVYIVSLSLLLHCGCMEGIIWLKNSHYTVP